MINERLNPESIDAAVRIANHYHIYRTLPTLEGMAEMITACYGPTLTKKDTLIRNQHQKLQEAQIHAFIEWCLNRYQNGETPYAHEVPDYFFTKVPWWKRFWRSFKLSMMERK
jgi:hypothetical protein